jgi:hypothetical protein
LIQTGAIINQSELSHFGRISSTQMTQIMWLDNFAPDIQEEILFLPKTIKGRDSIKEADIRPIAKTLDRNKQRQMWKILGPSKISFCCFAPMLDGDDMVWLMWQEGIVFVKQSVYTSVARSFTNQPAQFCGHILAHAFLASLFLASLPGTYLGFNHTHQQFSLLVLIQLVPYIHILLAGAVQLHYLRGSLGDWSRWPKAQYLFTGRA